MSIILKSLNLIYDAVNDTVNDAVKSNYVEHLKNKAMILGKIINGVFISDSQIQLEIKLKTIIRETPKKNNTKYCTHIYELIESNGVYGVFRCEKCKYIKKERYKLK